MTDEAVYFTSGEVVVCVDPGDSPFIVGERYMLLSFSADGYVKVIGFKGGWSLERFAKLEKK